MSSFPLWWRDRSSKGFIPSKIFPYIEVIHARAIHFHSCLPSLGSVFPLQSLQSPFSFPSSGVSSMLTFPLTFFIISRNFLISRHRFLFPIQSQFFNYELRLLFPVCDYNTIPHSCSCDLFQKWKGKVTYLLENIRIISLPHELLFTSLSN